MSSRSDGKQAAGGLRERKKAKTKNAIQRHAVRLFREQGYSATTVEQIAEAAEVSPSTVFRYFATKEDIVVSDDYDPIIFTAFESQPPQLSPVRAWRAALREGLRDMSSEERRMQRDRELLIFAVPELWGASLRNILHTLDTIAELTAKRAGRPAGDPLVRNFTGALFGVMMNVAMVWMRDPELDIVSALDDALGHLESGLPL